METSPEQLARQKIDASLTAAGWEIQDYRALNLSASRGIALREVPLRSGRCDYLLLVDRLPIGVVEAKKEGVTLSTVADQSGHYAANLPDFLAALAPGKLRFLYESTGVETRSTRRRCARNGECGGTRQTIAFFQQNLVMEPSGARQTAERSPKGQRGSADQYGHERAVADGVNVGYDVYRISTEVTAQGGKVDKGFVIDKRSRATRSRRQQLLDEDLVFAAPELDRSVVVPSQIRTVLQAFKDALETELFPGRTLVPKTLIFAKDDSHAEDIVHLVREVFGCGNDFAKKITYRAVHAVTGQPADCEQLIREPSGARSTRRRRARQDERGGTRQFRLSPQLRIAVTVDMIATGTDITAPRGSAVFKRGATLQSPAESRDNPLEVLLFLRDVRSRVYFEQMKGRGTRTLTPSEMQAVSGEDARTKDHFVIVDAVGVCDSDKTESRPLERLPTVGLEKMLKQVAFGDRSEDTLTSLASRLARLDRAITAPRRAELTQLAGGKTLAELSAALLRAFDPNVIAEKATGIPGASPDEVDPALFEKTRAQLALEACKPFDEPTLRNAITDARQEADQIIDVVTVDKVTSQGFDAAAKEKAEGLVRSFREYIEHHHAEIEALEILYSRSYRQRLTEEAPGKTAYDRRCTSPPLAHCLHSGTHLLFGIRKWSLKTS